MKTKKYMMALAIVGGMLFTAQATNIIDLNDQLTLEKQNPILKAKGNKKILTNG